MAEKLGRREAQSVVDCMLDEAERRGFAFAVAVVDPAGNLIAFGRTGDDCVPLFVRMAQMKAYTAATWGQDTKWLRENVVGRENIPMTWFGNPPLTAILGGVVLRDSKGRVLGAIGESGPPEQIDEELARIGEAHFKSL